MKNVSQLCVVMLLMIIMLSSYNYAQEIIETPVYEIAVIKIKYPEGTESIRMHPNNDVKVFDLDREANVQSTVILPFKKRAAKLLNDGRVMSYTQEKIPGTFIPKQEYFISDSEYGDIRKAVQENKNDNILNKEEIHKRIYEYTGNEFKVECYQYLKENGFIKSNYDNENHNISITIIGNTLGSGGLYFDTAHYMFVKETDRLFIIFCMGSSGRYSNYFQIFMYYDLNDKSFHHIFGSEEDKYHIGSNIDIFDKRKLLFYRTANSKQYDEPDFIYTNKIADGEGWQVCLYDISTQKLEVLTEKSKAGRHGGGEVLWSPDGTKFAFNFTREDIFADKLNNEALGIYIYDMKTNNYYRPTNKYMMEGIINWSPDSQSCILYRCPPYKVEGRPKEFEGYYRLDLTDNQVTPIMTNDVEYDPGGKIRKDGLGNFRRDFTWSPDGKYLAFCASFEEDGKAYDGLFTIASDGSGSPILLEKTPFLYDDKGKKRSIYYYYDPVWLDY